MQLVATNTLQGKAGTASVVAYTVTGDRIAAGVDSFEVIAQGLLASSTGIMYTVPASTQIIVKEILLANSTATPVTGVTFYINGTAATNQINGGFTLPASGTAVYADGIWQVYDGTGSLLQTVAVTLGSATPSSIEPDDAGVVGVSTLASHEDHQHAIVADVAGSIQPDDAAAEGVATSFSRSDHKHSNTAATAIDIAAANAEGVATSFARSDHAHKVPADYVTNAMLADAAANTMKGNYTASSDNPTDGALAANKFFARASTGNIAAKDITDFALTLIDDANASAARTTLDIQEGSTNWIDVSRVGDYVVSPMVAAGSGATNVTNLHAIMAAAPTGSVLYFPGGGWFNMTGKVTVPAKFFRFQGATGSALNGSMSGFLWSANVSDHMLTLTDGNWGSSFHDLIFSTDATQTAGAAVHVGENAYTNFFRCGFHGLSTGKQLNRCIDYTGDGSPTSISGAVSLIDYCQFSNFNEIAIMCNANVSTIVIANITINGANDTSTTGINVHRGGAVTIVNSDIIACNNNLLIDPAVSTVVASVFAINSYFDNSQGACIKITGAGASVRNKFIGCSFTTANTASPNTAFECSTTFNYGTSGMGLDIISCNVLNTFAASPPSGTGFAFTGGGDFSIINNNIAAWTTGISIAPAVTAGMMQPAILGNSIGPCGGYPANTTGINLAVGSVAYGPVQVTSNVLQGNTTNITNAMGANAPVLPNEALIQDNLGTGKDNYAARNTNTQAVPSSTLVDVTGISFPIVSPSLIYVFDAVIDCVPSVANATGVGIAVNCPAGATLNAQAVSAIGQTAAVRNTYFTQINTVQNSLITNNAFTGQIRIAGTIKAGTATSHTGTVQIRISDFTQTVTVQEGSWIRATKVV